MSFTKNNKYKIANEEEERALWNEITYSNCVNMLWAQIYWNEKN